VWIGIGGQMNACGSVSGEMKSGELFLYVWRGVRSCLDWILATVILSLMKALLTNDCRVAACVVVRAGVVVRSGNYSENLNVLICQIRIILQSSPATEEKKKELNLEFEKRFGDSSQKSELPSKSIR